MDAWLGSELVDREGFSRPPETVLFVNLFYWTGALGVNHKHFQIYTINRRSLQLYQERGLIRQDINLETLARLLFCINAGYLFSRYIFAPERNWDDKFEAMQMLDILMNGIASPDSEAT